MKPKHWCLLICTYILLLQLQSQLRALRHLGYIGLQAHQAAGHPLDPRTASTVDFPNHRTATQPRARATAAILVDELGSGILVPSGPQLHPTAAVAASCPPGRSGYWWLRFGTPELGERQHQSQRAANPIHRHGQRAHLWDVRFGGGLGHSVAERRDSRFRICQLNIHDHRNHHDTAQWPDAEQQRSGQGQYVPAIAGAVAQPTGNGLVK